MSKIFSVINHFLSSLIFKIKWENYLRKELLSIELGNDLLGAILEKRTEDFLVIVESELFVNHIQVLGVGLEETSDLEVDLLEVSVTGGGSLNNGSGSSVEGVH